MTSSSFLLPGLLEVCQLILLVKGVRGWWDRASLHEVLDLVHDCRSWVSQ